MDDELSADARQLIDVAMEQDVPPAEIVEGSWGMVVSRLTVETSRAEPPVDVAPAPRSRGWVGVAITVGVAVAVGALLWLAIRPKAQTPAATVTAPAGERPAPAKPPVATPGVATPPSPPVAASHTQLLVDAEAALLTDPTRALELVDRHAELAPLVDAERRMALRIVVLCALGRTEDAKGQAHAFFATSRGSQWTARVRASCAG